MRLIYRFSVELFNLRHRYNLCQPTVATERILAAPYLPQSRLQGVQGVFCFRHSTAAYCRCYLQHTTEPCSSSVTHKNRGLSVCHTALQTKSGVPFDRGQDAPDSRRSKGQVGKGHRRH